ncbi:MAG: FadR family transcriptional regulator [Rubellimicrobium sp.]|nr:FadR family transcriptional regulator [Rubellimicrobium sp.]
MKTIRPLTRPPTLHETVQESLRGFIAENDLKPGEALPPETELAHQLGISRNSVREAIKSLESLGILETRRGIGVFVKEFSFQPLLDNLAYGLGSGLRDIEELREIRRVLETGLIGRTVAMIPEADLAELREITARMHRRALKGESFAEEDQQFHHLLFRCQNNRMLTSLLEVFWRAFYKVSDFANLANSDPLATWQDHHDIVEAVARRDAEAARARLDRHYDGIMQVIDRNRATSHPGGDDNQ